MSDASDLRSPAGGAGVSGIGNHLHLVIYDKIWATRSLWGNSHSGETFSGFQKAYSFKYFDFYFPKLLTILDRNFFF